MSSNNDATDDSSTDFDKFAAHLSDEATDALEQIQQTVESAEDAATESADVAGPVVDALGDLSRGDRAGAANTALLLLDDNTRKEVAEARAAILATVSEAEQAGDEAQDVIDMVAAQVSDVAAAIDANDLSERLSGLLG